MKDLIPDLRTWKCTVCGAEYVDKDEHPGLDIEEACGYAGIEAQEHWLQGPVCDSCAQKIGIPDEPEE